jgi:hypothetical protein
MIESICAVLCLALTIVSCFIACFALVKVYAFEKSTHKIEYVTVDPQADFAVKLKEQLKDEEMDLEV